MHVRKMYLVRRSVEIPHHTVCGHFSCCLANTGFTQGLGLPQECWCRGQSSEVWLHV